MDARIQNLPFEPAALTGMSTRLLSSHHQNNCGGAVKRLNAIRGQLATTAFAAAPGFQLNGLKREELPAINSMLLHELYFASLGGDGQTMAPAMTLAMTLALDANFGSVERWREEIIAMGKALTGRLSGAAAATGVELGQAAVRLRWSATRAIAAAVGLRLHVRRADGLRCPALRAVRDQHQQRVSVSAVIGGAAGGRNDAQSRHHGPMRRCGPVRQTVVQHLPEPLQRQA